MLAENRDAFYCDMAETYHIFDIKAHPVFMIARLAAGLRETSRIRMIMEKRRLTREQTLMALIYDKVNWLCWAQSSDAQHHRNRPKSLYAMLSGADKKDRKVEGFATPEEFEKRRRELLGE